MGKILNLINSGRKLLQVALDFTSLKEALKIIKVIRDLDIDIYEAGTPLIKSHGLRDLSVLRSIVGMNKVLLADTKTADVAGIEAELVYMSGFDAFTVLAGSSDEVILSALNKAEELGLDVIIDTIDIDSNSLVKRLEELRSLGVKIVNIHTAIDVQRIRGITITDKLEVIKGIVGEFKNSLVFSVSGGIKPEDIPSLLDIGVDIVVIGSAITKSKNPRAAAIKALHHLRGHTL